jgi:hypothetical protein
MILVPTACEAIAALARQLGRPLQNSEEVRQSRRRLRSEAAALAAQVAVGKQPQCGGAILDGRREGGRSVASGRPSREAQAPAGGWGWRAAHGGDGGGEERRGAGRDGQQRGRAPLCSARESTGCRYRRARQCLVPTAVRPRRSCVYVDCIRGTRHSVATRPRRTVAMGPNGRQHAGSGGAPVAVMCACAGAKLLVEGVPSGHRGSLRVPDTLRVPPVPLVQRSPTAALCAPHAAGSTQATPAAHQEDYGGRHEPHALLLQLPRVPTPSPSPARARSMAAMWPCLLIGAGRRAWPAHARPDRAAVATASPAPRLATQRGRPT